ncbi:MAG TPA: RluA family pseudouridine synthase [Polyangiaceae bacterium]|jgi:23S rRNA pseudouridine1911/1915/1917 synthase|nr:RluA family pseudouridine synthase [Polyangiaceae bacterium]
MAKGPRALRVSSDLEGPVDRAVRGLFGTSWGQARAWIAGGKVRVGGVVVTEPTARVRADVEVVVDEAARRPRPEELADEDVVYSDAQVVVVAKPPGISTIPYDESETDTLDARVRAWLERRRLVPRGARPTLGVVHRIDKETSGLVVFTRTWLAKQSLSGQFRRHTVHRRYLAIAHGDVPGRTIRSFLVENRGDGLRGSLRGPAAKRPPASAQEAITHLDRIEALRGATYLGCRLETGRTHQIRIHLSEMGHPLAGDRVYTRGFLGPLLEAPRLMLHAAELGFVHPSTEREMRWERPAPDDMTAVLSRLRGEA